MHRIKKHEHKYYLLVEIQTWNSLWSIVWIATLWLMGTPTIFWILLPKESKDGMLKTIIVQLLNQPLRLYTSTQKKKQCEDPRIYSPILFAYMTTSHIRKEKLSRKWNGVRSTLDKLVLLRKQNHPLQKKKVTSLLQESIFTISNNHYFIIATE